MNVLNFIQNIPDRGLRETLGKLRVAVRRQSGWLEHRATNVFDREWDVLVILDGCRADLLDSVADEYDFLKSNQSIYSVGATSSEWMENTFGSVDSNTLAETGYVTGNAHLSHVDVDPREFGVLDEVWRYGWDDDIGTVKPRTMTDRAIAVHRECDIDRLIVHYMQPHAPFLDDPDLTDGMTIRPGENSDSPSTVDVWDQLQNGKVSVAEAWAASQRNLCRALDEVAILQENLDADRLVLSADHGNAMGELGQYGHGRGKLVDGVCRVPWVVTDATDTGEFTPTVEPESEDRGRNVDETLRSLGYKT